MAIDYVMPKLAMAMNEGTVNEWLVKQGDKVEKAQALVTVETEKVTYDCESPEAGIINIVLPEGDTVPCETLIAHFCESEEELAELVAAGSSVPAAEATLESVDKETASSIASPAPVFYPISCVERSRSDHGRAG